VQSGHLQLGGLLRVNYLDSARECVCFVRLFVCLLLCKRQKSAARRVGGGRRRPWLGLLPFGFGGACGGHRLDAHVSASLAAPPGKSPRPVLPLHTPAAKCAHADDARNHYLSLSLCWCCSQIWTRHSHLPPTFIEAAQMDSDAV
jgi:hypothetical protein